MPSVGPGTGTILKSLPIDFGNNLICWHDGSDLGTIVIGASGGIAAIRDKGWRRVTASQPTGSAQPKTGNRSQNGLPVIDFTPNQYFQTGTIPGTLQQPVTIWGVVIQDVSSRWLDGTTSRVLVTPDVVHYGLNAGTTVNTATNLVTGAWEIQTHVVNGASSFIRRNGVDLGLSGNVGTNSFNGSTIFYGYDNFSSYFNGALGEWIIVLGHWPQYWVPMENYLAAKWAIPLTAGHSPPLGFA